MYHLYASRLKQCELGRWYIKSISKVYKTYGGLSRAVHSYSNRGFLVSSYDDCMLKPLVIKDKPLTVNRLRLV